MRSASPREPARAAMCFRWPVDRLKVLSFVFFSVGSLESGHVRVVSENATECGGAAAVQATDKDEATGIYLVQPTSIRTQSIWPTK